MSRVKERRPPEAAAARDERGPWRGPLGICPEEGSRPRLGSVEKRSAIRSASEALPGAQPAARSPQPAELVPARLQAPESLEAFGAAASKPLIEQSWILQSKK